MFFVVLQFTQHSISLLLLYTSRKAALLLSQSEVEYLLASEEELEDYDDHVEGMMGKMATVCDKIFFEAAVNITESQRRYKRDYDKNNFPAEVYKCKHIVITLLSK